MKLIAADLFSGIGMFSYALRGCVTTKLYCEIDPFAQQVLKKRIDTGDLERATIVPDIKQLTGQALIKHHINVLLCGAPCCGFSTLGFGAGFDDERSKLGLEIFRLIREQKGSIKAVFMENVPSKKLLVGLKPCIPKGFDIKFTIVSGENTQGSVIRKRWFAIIYERNSWDKLAKQFPSSLPKLAKRKEPTRWTIRDIGSFPLNYLNKFRCTGNTINPICLKTAFVHLFHGTPLITYKRERYRVHITMHNLNYKRHFWPSPKTKLCMGRLTRRSITTLDGALRWDRKTVSFWRKKKILPAQVLPSINWVLYLLQIPTHWLNV